MNGQMMVALRFAESGMRIFVLPMLLMHMVMKQNITMILMVIPTVLFILMGWKNGISEMNVVV